MSDDAFNAIGGCLLVWVAGFSVIVVLLLIGEFVFGMDGLLTGMSGNSHE